MKKFKHFLLYRDISEIPTDNAYVLYISDLKSKDELFCLYKQSLNFPDYFGFNWDAFTDALSYLDEWMNKKTILIIHKNMPYIEEEGIRNYLHVLNKICDVWGNNSDKLLFRVYFPEVYHDMIQEFFE